MTFYNNGVKRFQGMSSNSYLNNLLNSFVTIFSNKGTKVYEGYFKEGRKNGFGILFNSNFTQVGYRGGWNLDMKDGYGVLYYDNGNK